MQQLHGDDIKAQIKLAGWSSTNCTQLLAILIVYMEASEIIVTVFYMAIDILILVGIAFIYDIQRCPNHYIKMIGLWV